jgi:hypothetical protein
MNSNVSIANWIRLANEFTFFLMRMALVERRRTPSQLKAIQEYAAALCGFYGAGGWIDPPTSDCASEGLPKR